MPTSTRNRRAFSKDFKLGAVKMVTEQGYSTNEAARRFEIDRKTLSEWIVKYAPHYKPGQADKALAGDPKALLDELRQMRRENERLREDNAILKKATAYFAKQSP
jgi:transposase